MVGGIQRLRATKAKITYDFEACTITARWPDGFGATVKTQTPGYMDYTNMAARLLDARETHLRIKKLQGKCTEAERRLTDEQLVAEYIAHNGVTRVPTAHVFQSSGQHAEWKTPDTAPVDEQVRLKMSRNSKAGWQRRRMWKQGMAVG